MLLQGCSKDQRVGLSSPHFRRNGNGLKVVAQLQRIEDPIKPGVEVRDHP